MLKHIYPKISSEANVNGLYMLRPRHGVTIPAKPIKVAHWEMELCAEKQAEHSKSPTPFPAEFSDARITLLPKLSPADFIAIHNKLAQSTSWIPIEAAHKNWDEIREHAKTFVLHQDGLPLGFAHIIPPNHQSQICIEYIGLFPENRGHGLGGSFMSQLIQMLDQQHPNCKFLLHTTAQDMSSNGNLAAGYHEKMGFVISSQIGSMKKMDASAWYRARQDIINERYDRSLPKIQAALLAFQ